MIKLKKYADFINEDVDKERAEQLINDISGNFDEMVIEIGKSKS